MEKGLEKVLETYEEQFGFSTEGLKEKYIGFLERQFELHPEYDLEYKRVKGRGRGATEYPWLNLIIDKLLLFSYMIGEAPILASRGNVRFIGRHKNKKLKPIEERAVDLRFFSGKAMGEGKHKKNRTDKRLYRLYARQLNRKYKPAFKGNHQSWRDIIDELGQDIEVMKYFGRRVTYERDVMRRI
ncbi:hypothetical protein KY339_02545 [Candidatus Woesearchaeota archaeon]|nr:hypothetical protein [Candidatus Woesearchaeota archaeon]